MVAIGVFTRCVSPPVGLRSLRKSSAHRCKARQGKASGATARRSAVETVFSPRLSQASNVIILGVSVAEFLVKQIEDRLYLRAAPVLVNRSHLLQGQSGEHLMRQLQRVDQHVNLGGVVVHRERCAAGVSCLLHRRAATQPITCISWRPT